LNCWCCLCHWFCYFSIFIIDAYCSLIKIGLGNNFEVILFKLFSDSSEIRVALIEGIAISNDLVNVSMKLSWRGILTCFKVLLNFGQIHRLFNDFQIMRNSHCYWVHRFSKSPRCFAVLQQIQYFDTGLQRFIQSLISISSANFRSCVSWNIFSIPNLNFIIISNICWFFCSYGGKAIHLRVLLLVLDYRKFYLIE